MSFCPHKDIIQRIVSKIEEADAIIITSPVYSMQITGLLKNFIDHMSYNFHRPRFFYKKVLTMPIGFVKRTFGKFIFSRFYKK
ncbi:NAD(P)H-dependent oxidoreductase [Clostridium sp. 1001271B_151109_B4]|uniref:NAD(P)H-dependent oxidoreductase n=1 Tax=Clostridium sp. 1001271B_151109_B4 TaxID=2787148 RepID=UPI0018AAD349